MNGGRGVCEKVTEGVTLMPPGDRKSTRLNSSHSQISYAVFRLNKNNKARRVTLRLTSTYHASRIRHPTSPAVMSNDLALRFSKPLDAAPSHRAFEALMPKTIQK